MQIIFFVDCQSEFNHFLLYFIYIHANCVLNQTEITCVKRHTEQKKQRPSALLLCTRTRDHREKQKKIVFRKTEQKKLKR